MTVTVLYFASVRERLGREREELASMEMSVGEICRQLGERGGVWAEVFSGSKLPLTALNQDMVKADAMVRDGDELAFFPTVTGG